MSRVINVRVPDRIGDTIDEIAKKTKLSITQIVIAALASGLHLPDLTNQEILQLAIEHADNPEVIKAIKGLKLERNGD